MAYMFITQITIGRAHYYKFNLGFVFILLSLCTRGWFSLIEC